MPYLSSSYIMLRGRYFTLSSRNLLSYRLLLTADGELCHISHIHRYRCLKMASSRPRKRTKKDTETAFQKAINKSNRLLELSKKPRKKTRFRISRNPLTGRRITHYPYKPRCQDDQSSKVKLLALRF